MGWFLQAAALAGLLVLVLRLQDILGGKFRAVEGTGQRMIISTADDDGSRTTRLYYGIEGMKFRVQQAGFTAFEDGRAYRAYYTPLRKALVNIELVE